MKYWLIVLPRERLELCIKLGIFGLTRKFLLGQMQVGDPIACYVTKEKKIAALGAVTGPYFVDDKDVFKDPKLYVDRINFQASWLDEEIDFMDILAEMKFIKNPVYWTAHLNGGVAEIKKSDWEVICSQAQVLSNK